MLWLQVWLQETASMGPRCADGYLLRDLELLRRDCPEEERNVELVAPGCEAELLSAPGVYGTSPILSPWMNLKAINGTEDRNSLAPAPEDSEYFYDEYVDYPYNETNGKLAEASTIPSSHVTAGDTPTIYASSKAKKPDKDIPKEVNNSPSTSGFTFFGVPLPNIGNLLSNAVNARRDDRIAPQRPQPIKMNDRMAIVNNNKPTGSPSVTRIYNAPPNLPKVETGGFIPILPGSGGFKPIPNPLTRQAQQIINDENKRKGDASTVASQNVAVSTTNRPKEPITTEAIITTTSLDPMPPPSTTTISSLASPLNVTTTTLPMTTETITKTSLINNATNRKTNLDNDSKEVDNVTTTTELIPETTTTLAPIEESTTTTTLLTTTVMEPLEQQHTTILKPFNIITTTISPAFLVPGGQQPLKKMATITKVPSPNVPSASAPLRSDYDALPPMAHNREPKTMVSDPQTESPQQNGDMSWYFATYNNTNGCSSRGVSSGDKQCNFMCIFVVVSVFKNYLII